MTDTTDLQDIWQREALLLLEMIILDTESQYARMMIWDFLKIRIRERHLQRMHIILQFLSRKCILVFHIILQDTAWGRLLQEDIYVITDMNLMELL